MRDLSVRMLLALICGTLLPPAPRVRAEELPPPPSTIRGQDSGIVNAYDVADSRLGMPGAEFLPYLSISPVSVAPVSGMVEDFTDHAWAAQLAYTRPWLVRETDHGTLQLALQGNVQQTVFDVRRDVFGFDPDTGFVSVDSLHTTLFGFGPNVTYFLPPTEEGRQAFVGLSALGNVGWGQAMMSDAPAGAAFGRVIPIQGALIGTDSSVIWGTTLSSSTGVVFRNGVALSLSAGWTLWRTDLIQGTERDSDLVFGALNVQVPTEALLKPFQSWRCP